MTRKMFTNKLSNSTKFVRKALYRNSMNSAYLNFGNGGGVNNGDTVTITGAGFGDVAPEVLLWDTVDNVTLYESYADGANVPNTSETAEALYAPTSSERFFTLVSDNTYSGYGGGRGRGYRSAGSSYLRQPKGANDNTALHTKMYASFMMRSDCAPTTTDSSNKFFRVWNTDDGSVMKVSFANHQLMYVNVADGGDAITEDRRGISWADQWVRYELLVDTDNNVIVAKAGNVIDSKLSDEQIILPEPLTKGLVMELFGYDDGDSGAAGYNFDMSDIYIDTAGIRVELHSAPDYAKSYIREIQQITSVSDGAVKFTMDAVRLDPSNCYASVITFNTDGTEQVLQTLAIGTPLDVIPGTVIPVEQYIRRPSAPGDLYEYGVKTISGISTTDGNFVFECDFLILPHEDTGLTMWRFLHDGGYTCRINFDPVNNLWQFRSGYGTADDAIAPVVGGWDDGKRHHLKVIADPDTGTAEFYVDDMLDGSTSGLTINAIAPDGSIYFGWPIDATQEAAGYGWNIKLTDTTTPSNSHYWPLDEQTLGIDDIRDEAQGLVGGTLASEIAWQYLPDEGY